MTDKARELLELSLQALELHCSDYTVLSKEIRAYLAKPEVKRKRLSDEEIEAEYWDSIEWTSLTTFLAGVRFAEKHHGIGGGDCPAPRKPFVRLSEEEINALTVAYLNKRIGHGYAKDFARAIEDALEEKNK